MSKLNMTFKLIAIIISLTLFVCSCINTHSSERSTSKTWFDTTAYPKRKFTSVTLFILDSLQKTTLSSDSGTYVDKTVLEYVGNAGYSFVGKNGIPKTSNYKSFELDSLQIQRLMVFLTQEPCSSDLYMDKACAPTFKNVFVFYDETQKSLAQVHVCFRCEKTAFIPDEAYMCDFDNKVDYKALQVFTNSICRKEDSRP